MFSAVTLLVVGCSATAEDPVDDAPDPPGLPTVIGGADALSQSDVGGDTGNVTPPDGPCAGKPDGVACDDGDPCTLGDGCAAGVCVGGQNDPCDAEGPCRIGWCEPETGCVYEDAAEGADCGVACFDAASCQAGKCEPDPTSGTVCPEPE
ncbi:MAG: hypothetical protein VX938_02845, partial [Myxococcota bacterium]|nr:hypothetical protein [Myxococcota bacterium]